MKIVIDTETTWQLINDKTYPLPFDPRNKLVTFQYYKENGETDIFILDHKDIPTDITHGVTAASVQRILSEATLLIGHNIKFDVMWLRECGFEVNCPLYDTMINEYIRAKGMKVDLSLKGCAERYNLTRKSDVLGAYMKEGVNTDAIPLNELSEYALSDCVTTYELYKYQQTNPIGNTEAVEAMMNEFVDVLVTMERNGVYIDLEELDKIENDYKKEFQELEAKLNLTIYEVMGDTPFNLSSPEQLSQIIYSRKIIDKKHWKETFNLGTELRNSVTKKRRPYRMKDSKFAQSVREGTQKVYKTRAVRCDECNGIGSFRKKKKDGTDFKKDSFCHKCNRTGIYYENTDKIAGFKLVPKGTAWVSESGFATNKTLMQSVISDVNIKPALKEFLTDYLRYSAIETYLSSFIDGIRRNVRNGILHVNFNQCVTATGRLSSSNPNFQNLPRDKTFPIRRVIRSRWKDGKIIDCDLAQLEFRVAAILSGCQAAKEDIINGVDIHAYTAKILTDAGQSTDRQTAKSHTFKPLYGGLSGTDAEVTYYKAFLQKYRGIATWHEELSNEAITTKQVVSKSGRVYAFPYAKRMPNGKASSYTQIVNYCVQGFATGDITPCIMIDMQKEFTKRNLKSLLILTVHDSVTADICPGEEKVVIEVFRTVFDRIIETLKTRFKIEISIPIAYDLSIGSNWSEKKKVA